MSSRKISPPPRRRRGRPRLPQNGLHKTTEKKVFVKVLHSAPAQSSTCLKLAKGGKSRRANHSDDHLSIAAKRSVKAEPNASPPLRRRRGRPTKAESQMPGHQTTLADPKQRNPKATLSSDSDAFLRSHATKADCSEEKLETSAVAAVLTQLEGQQVAGYNEILPIVSQLFTSTVGSRDTNTEESQIPPNISSYQRFLAHTEDILKSLTVSRKRLQPIKPPGILLGEKGFQGLPADDICRWPQRAESISSSPTKDAPSDGDRGSLLATRPQSRSKNVETECSDVLEDLPFQSGPCERQLRSEPNSFLRLPGLSAFGFCDNNSHNNTESFPEYPNALLFETSGSNPSLDVIAETPSSKSPGEHETIPYIISVLQAAIAKHDARASSKERKRRRALSNERKTTMATCHSSPTDAPADQPTRYGQLRLSSAPFLYPPASSAFTCAYFPLPRSQPLCAVRVKWKYREQCRDEDILWDTSESVSVLAAFVNLYIQEFRLPAIPFRSYLLDVFQRQVSTASQFHALFNTVCTYLTRRLGLRSSRHLPDITKKILLDCHYQGIRILDVVPWNLTNTDVDIKEFLQRSIDDMNLPSCFLTALFPAFLRSVYRAKLTFVQDNCEEIWRCVATESGTESHESLTNSRKRFPKVPLKVDDSSPDNKSTTRDLIADPKHVQTSSKLAEEVHDEDGDMCPRKSKEGNAVAASKDDENRDDPFTKELDAGVEGATQNSLEIFCTSSLETRKLEQNQTRRPHSKDPSPQEPALSSDDNDENSDTTNVSLNEKPANKDVSKNVERKDSAFLIEPKSSIRTLRTGYGVIRRDVGAVTSFRWGPVPCTTSTDDSKDVDDLKGSVGVDTCQTSSNQAVTADDPSLSSSSLSSFVDTNSEKQQFIQRLIPRSVVSELSQGASAVPATIIEELESCGTPLLLRTCNTGPLTSQQIWEVVGHHSTSSKILRTERYKNKDSPSNYEGGAPLNRRYAPHQSTYRLSQPRLLSAIPTSTVDRPGRRAASLAVNRRLERDYLYHNAT